MRMQSTFYGDIMLHQWTAAALPGGLLERQTQANLITIVGTGPIARALAIRMLHARHRVTILGDDQSVRALLKTLGSSAAGGRYGDPIAGLLVLLAVPYPATLAFVRDHRSLLEDKIVVDLSNPVGATTSNQLAVKPRRSAAEDLSDLLGGRTRVVKAFSTVTVDALEPGSPDDCLSDVFIAGDSGEAKAVVGRLVASMGMNSIDCGPLRRSRELEAIMLIVLLRQPLTTAEGAQGTAVVARRAQQTPGSVLVKSHDPLPAGVSE